MMTEAEAVRRARAMYEADDLAIDDEPKTSPSDDGTWVAAWVWVPNKDDDYDD